MEENINKDRKKPEFKRENAALVWIQSILSFIAMFIIAIGIVILFMPGDFNTKVSDIVKYIQATAGLEAKTPEIEENSILDNTIDTPNETNANINSNSNISTISQIPNTDSAIQNNSSYIPQSYNIEPSTLSQNNAETQVAAVSNNQLSSDPKVVATTLYYSQLNPYGKIIYDKLSKESAYFLNGVHTFDYGTVFNELLNQPNGEQELNMAFQAGVNALMLDYPQLYFVDVTKITLKTKAAKHPPFSTVYSVSISNIDGQTFYADGLNTRAEVDEIRAKMEEIRNTVLSNASRSTRNTYEYIKYIHDYVIDTIVYDDSGIDSKKYNLCFATLEGRAVCEGYAKLFKYLMDGAGIPTVTVTGEGINSRGEKENHAWNQVYFEGEWYAVDTTWDDPIIIGGGKATEAHRTRYFLVGQREFEGNHIATGNVTPGVYFGSINLPAQRYVYTR